MVAYTWTGGGADNNWTTPGNWNVGTNYPGYASGDTATIATGSKGITVNASKSLATLTVQSSYTGTITFPSYGLSVVGNITITAGSITATGSGYLKLVGGTANFNASAFGGNSLNFFVNGTCTLNGNSTSLAFKTFTILAGSNVTITSGFWGVGNGAGAGGFVKMYGNVYLNGGNLYDYTPYQNENLSEFWGNITASSASYNLTIGFLQIAAAPTTFNYTVKHHGSYDCPVRFMMRDITAAATINLNINFIHPLCDATVLYSTGCTNTASFWFQNNVWSVASIGVDAGDTSGAPYPQYRNNYFIINVGHANFYRYNADTNCTVVLRGSGTLAGMNGGYAFNNLVIEKGASYTMSGHVDVDGCYVNEGTLNLNGNVLAYKTPPVSEVIIDGIPLGTIDSIEVEETSKLDVMAMPCSTSEDALVFDFNGVIRSYTINGVRGNGMAVTNGGIIHALRAMQNGFQSGVQCVIYPSNPSRSVLDIVTVYIDSFSFRQKAGVPDDLEFTVKLIRGM